MLDKDREPFTVLVASLHVFFKVNVTSISLPMYVSGFSSISYVTSCKMTSSIIVRTWCCVPFPFIQVILAMKCSSWTICTSYSVVTILIFPNVTMCYEQFVWVLKILRETFWIRVQANTSHTSAVVSYTSVFVECRLAVLTAERSSSDPAIQKES